MKIYVLFYRRHRHSYDKHEVLGIFSSKEAAEAAKSEFEKHDSKLYYSNLYIDES